MINRHEGWCQGHFIDSDRYKKWSESEKNIAEFRENHLVRPSPTGNAICQCYDSQDAKWIAERLNLAAKLENTKFEKNPIECDFHSKGWKYLALEKFTLFDEIKTQSWYGIRIFFFRIWIGKYYK